MAFILRSSKYVNSFLGLARRASLTFRREKTLLLSEYTNIFRFNELWARTLANAVPKPSLAFPVSVEKSINHLHNNLKASMVDLNTVHATLNFLKENGSISPTQLILLLRCCGTAAFRDSEESRIKMAKNVWDTAKELGTEFDIAHYNTLLSVFVENSYKFEPDEILSDIKQAGLEPNRVTYRQLLKGYCQQGNIKGASNMLEKIKQKKFPINEYDFCSLIQGHCEAGELEEAAKVFNVMKDRGINPTVDPYVYLVCGYAKYGNIEKMEELLDELEKLNLPVSDAYLLNVVYTLIVNNRAEHIDSVLSRMKKTNNYEKTLSKVVHRILHKNKDEEALKLFSMLSQMGVSKEYIRDEALGIIEHFVFHRSPKELINICHKMQEEGWTNIAFSHALKKAVLKKDIDYCSSLLMDLRRSGFPLRSHYFWPLIVRYSELGNSGIISVMRVMKALNVSICYNTLQMFIKEYYKFSEDWESDLDILRTYGAKESHVCLFLLNSVLMKGEIIKAEVIASSYGVHRPQSRTLNMLVRCFVKSCPHEEEKFLKILYYLAHDFEIYNSVPSVDANDGEEDTEITGLNTFFDKAFQMLMKDCPEDVFLSVLQNASKKKVIIPPQTATSIRERFPNPNVDALLKEFTDSNEFELDQELLKKKSLNAMIVPKSLDPNGIQNLANKNDLSVVKLWEELGSKASLEDNVAMFAMFARLNMFDKAFAVIDRLKEMPGNPDTDVSLDKRFRISLHLLRRSGNVEKIIDAYRTGVKLGLIEEEYVITIIRTILQGEDYVSSLEKYREFFEKIKSVGAFLEIMDHLIPTENSEAVNKMTEIYANTANPNVAYTALFTAYLVKGKKTKAREILENQSFKFQPNVFLYWFRNIFRRTNMTFEETMEIVKELDSRDRIHVYEFLLPLYEKSRDIDKMNMLWVQCQEDDITDPFFLERLRHSLRRLEKDSSSPGDRVEKFADSSNSQWLEERELKKILDMLRVNKYTQDTLEKLLSKRLPSLIARKMLPVLAAEGKSYELILVINKYRFERFVPEVVSELLKNNKVNEFLEFVCTQASMKKYGSVYNSFVSHQDLVLNLMKTDEEFFRKFKELSLRCYEQGKFEALLVHFIKLCVQTPERLATAEEILAVQSSGIASHFRNYALSDLLLSLTEDVDFYKNVLSSKRVKSLFSETLDHFYERVIKFYNEKGDVESALSFLEKAKQDGLDRKLDKKLISSLKKNMENKGTAFPYPQLVQEAA